MEGIWSEKWFMSQKGLRPTKNTWKEKKENLVLWRDHKSKKKREILGSMKIKKYFSFSRFLTRMRWRILLHSKNDDIVSREGEGKR